MNRSEAELGEVDERSEEIPLCGAKPRPGGAKSVPLFYRKSGTQLTHMVRVGCCPFYSSFVKLISNQVLFSIFLNLRPILIVISIRSMALKVNSYLIFV